MLGNSNFYNKSVRIYTAAFSDFFNDISIERDNGKVIKVPIAFGGKQKYIQRLEQGKIPDGEPRVKMVVPRMAYMITGMSYDSARQKQKTQRISAAISSSNTTSRNYQYTPVPYNLNFQLSILANSLEDMLAIIEQILPYFSPEFNFTIKDNPLFDDDSTFSDIPLLLTAVNPVVEYEGVVDENRRVITCDLDFVMKINLFGPVNIGKIIKHVIVNYRDLDYENEANNMIAKYEVQPNPTNAGPDDDYTYTETITDYTNDS